MNSTTAADTITAAVKNCQVWDCSNAATLVITCGEYGTVAGVGTPASRPFCSDCGVKEIEFMTDVCDQVANGSAVRVAAIVRPIRRPAGWIRQEIAAEEWARI